MRKFLYDDIYEGLLHILILSLPILVGMLEYFLKWSNTLPVSLLISIVGEFYSARSIYKNTEYFNNKRIKIEMVIVLLLLAVSLCLTVLFLQIQISGEASNADSTLFPDFTYPVIFYAGSALPYVFEVIVVILNEFNCFSKQKPRINKSTFSFNVTSAGVN